MYIKLLDMPAILKYHMTKTNILKKKQKNTPLLVRGILQPIEKNHTNNNNNNANDTHVTQK